MSQATLTNENTSTAVVKQTIPIQLTSYSTFDDTYAFIRERFLHEMKRVDSHMNHLHSALKKVYNQTLTVQTANTDSDWDSIENSPLVEGYGEDKTMKLQFDLTQFDPEEITVTVANDLLTVSATHEEETDKFNIFREYNREFQLPKGTNPDRVISSMSRDGILTVTAPLICQRCCNC